MWLLENFKAFHFHWTGILKGPQERPRFQDNTNSFLGEDTVVEPGVLGMNGTWRPVGGGKEAGWTEGRPNGSWTSPRGVLERVPLVVSAGWAVRTGRSGLGMNGPTLSLLW